MQNIKTMYRAATAAGLIALAVAAAGPAFALDPPISAELKFVPTGVSDRVGYYIPERLMLTPNKPAKITNEPKYQFTPLYGSIHFGTAKDDLVVIALDEAPDASSGKLYVDANGDGDLANDPPVTWERHAQHAQDNTGKPLELVTYIGGASITPRLDRIANGSMNDPVGRSIKIYRFAPETAKLRGLPTDMLLYYRDYGAFGRITLTGKTYDVALLDERAVGRFDDIIHELGGKPRVNLLIDRNGDGRFDSRYESYDLNLPFNIGGVVYQAALIAPDGSKLVLMRSNQKVQEIPIPADLSVGKQALGFKRLSIEGSEVRFPDDFKGKLVMLDFWATWCPPCRGEIPGLVKAYNKYHDRGFEVLGVSLDQPNQVEMVKGFLKDNGMTWRQIYDGKNAAQEIAGLYSVTSIPHALLVNGSTGAIVASGDELRGDGLDPAIAKALAGHKRADAR